MSYNELLCRVQESCLIPSLNDTEDETGTVKALKALAQTNECRHPATTYPRVLPASLPRVSEPERNHGESLVLPGLEVLPAPELLFNFDLGKKQEVEQSQNSPKLSGNKPGFPGLITLVLPIVKYQPMYSLINPTKNILHIKEQI